MAVDLSIIINEAEQRRNQLRRGRKSSLVPWETSLEDVQEDEDDDEEEEEDSMMEGTVLEAGEEEEVDVTMEDEEQVSLKMTDAPEPIRESGSLFLNRFWFMLYYLE